MIYGCATRADKCGIGVVETDDHFNARQGSTGDVLDLPFEAKLSMLLQSLLCYRQQRQAWIR